MNPPDEPLSEPLPKDLLMPAPSGTTPGRRPRVRPADAFGLRWPQLARAARIEPGERLLVALSGGADSVLLLHLLAAAQPRPDLMAAHVHHGLRGAEADRDAEFCADLCASLGVPFRLTRAQLDPRREGLEARAREARYRLLLELARAEGGRTLLTGHHADDGLETVMMRWLRGTHPSGCLPARREMWVKGPYPACPPEERHGLTPVRVVRPLCTLRREEVRRLLDARGLAWREDSSNQDPSFARNAMRNLWLPALDAALGPGAREGLLGFAQAVERLEDGLAKATAHLCWKPAHHALVTRGSHTADLGGWVARSELTSLPEPLLRRALWRLLVEGSGRAPQRQALESLCRDLLLARTGRRSLPGGWILVLRSAEILLVPPPRALGPRPAPPAPSGAPSQLLLPFPGAPLQRVAPGRTLSVPGWVRLPDGRAIGAEWIEDGSGRPVPKGAAEVELDGRGLRAPLCVRYPVAGDRFHPLGGPGSRPLGRFLADAGVPREERAFVPLVVCGEEILWVVGLRPSQTRRITASTVERLRLSLVAQEALRAG